MQLPQSTVSRHLKALADGGWIAARAEGTSNLYTMTRDDLDASARRLWLLVREQVGATAGAAQDQRRLQAALAERRTKSQEFFSSSAGQWDRLRDELFGDRFHLAALAAFADPDWVVGDLGCGTGQVSAALAPFVARVVAVDASAAMLQAARKRLHGFDNVDLRRGELEALPIDDGRLDAATLMLVLHHVPEPARALAEVARVLKPGGRVILVDMLPHDREQLPAADGPRLARLLGRAHAAAAGRRRIRRHADRPAAAGRQSQGSGVVRRDGTRTQTDTTVTRRKQMATVVEKLHPFAAAESRRPRAVQGEGSLARRVRPQGNPPRRAGDAGPDGAPRAARREEAARRRAHHGQPAHDDSDGGPHRDAGRARRRRALGLVQHLLDAGSRRRGGRRRTSRNRRHRAESRRARRSSRGRARRSRSTGGARTKRSSGPTAAARR